MKQRYCGTNAACTWVKKCLHFVPLLAPLCFPLRSGLITGMPYVKLNFLIPFNSSCSFLQKKSFFSVSKRTYFLYFGHKEPKITSFVSFLVTLYIFLILATKKPESLRSLVFSLDYIFLILATKKPSVSLSCGQMRRVCCIEG